MTARVAMATCLVLGAAAASGWAAAPLRNGFVLSPASIEVAEILHGGPPRDGIPALDHPAHVSATDSPWHDDEVVVGVAWQGQARAYPLSILVWHELVNDTLGGRPILVSYCPLCGTAIVFDRRVDGDDGGPRSFGVSGETESLWSQIKAAAVTGPSQGQRLALVRSRMVSWLDWQTEYPESSVLSLATGFQRRYEATPYGDYATSPRLLFPAPRDARYHPKTPTIGLRAPEGEARAYPALELARAGGVARESFAGRPVSVAYDPERRVFEVEAPAEIEVVEGYWFAWAAFHPDTSVFTPPGPARSGSALPAQETGPKQTLR
jgi:hypothetical protein